MIWVPVVTLSRCIVPVKFIVEKKSTKEVGHKYSMQDSFLKTQKLCYHYYTLYSIVTFDKLESTYKITIYLLQIVPVMNSTVTITEIAMSIFLCKENRCF